MRRAIARGPARSASCAGVPSREDTGPASAVEARSRVLGEPVVPAAAAAGLNILHGMPGMVVMKFGGTSVADAERIKRAARRIVDKREAGHSVVAELSPRRKTTDQATPMAEG